MEALEINNGIRSLLQRLEKLAKLANSKKIYDDRSAEVKELTFIINKELKALTARMETLRGTQQGGDATGGSSGNKATFDHRNGVVTQLSGQLANVSTRFTEVLQLSSSNMRAQRDRREQFGAATSLLPSAGPTGPSQRSVAKARSGTASLEDRPQGGNSHVAIEMPFQKMALAEPQTDTSYLESRNTALQGIEATMNELTAIYQKLAHMVTQQGESIQRIDMNIEDMQVNVRRGQEQLVRYLRSVSSNRALMIKLFAVLIVFSIVFTFFFT